MLVVQVELVGRSGFVEGVVLVVGVVTVALLRIAGMVLLVVGGWGVVLVVRIVLVLKVRLRH